MKAVLMIADNSVWICLFGPLVTSCFIQWALLLPTNLCGDVSPPRSACHHIALSFRTKRAKGEYQISCQDQTEMDCESRRQTQQCWWSRSSGSCCHRRQRRFGLIVLFRGCDTNMETLSVSIMMRLVKWKQENQFCDFVRLSLNLLTATIKPVSRDACWEGCMGVCVCAVQSTRNQLFSSIYLHCVSWCCLLAHAHSALREKSPFKNKYLLFRAAQTETIYEDSATAQPPPPKKYPHVMSNSSTNVYLCLSNDQQLPQDFYKTVPRPNECYKSYFYDSFSRSWIATLCLSNCPMRVIGQYK